MAWFYKYKHSMAKNSIAYLLALSSEKLYKVDLYYLLVWGSLSDLTFSMNTFLENGKPIF